MPGALSEWHILDQLTVTPNQQMAGNLQVCNLLEVRMCTGVQRIGKKTVNFGSTIPAWRQTDTVYHDQGYPTPVRALIAIRRRDLAGLHQEISAGINFHVLIITRCRIGTILTLLPDRLTDSVIAC